MSNACWGSNGCTLKMAMRSGNETPVQALQFVFLVVHQEQLEAERRARAVVDAAVKMRLGVWHKLLYKNGGINAVQKEKEENIFSSCIETRQAWGSLTATGRGRRGSRQPSQPRWHTLANREAARDSYLTSTCPIAVDARAGRLRVSRAMWVEFVRRLMRWCELHADDTPKDLLERKCFEVEQHTAEGWTGPDPLRQTWEWRGP